MPRNAPPSKGKEGADDLSFFLSCSSRYKVMTREEERVLALKVREGGPEGERARNEFVQRNMRLVVSIAKGYICADMPLPDLVQEGCIGVIRALDKFDPDRGFKFSTYASWWIRQAITRARHSAGLIRLPSHVAIAHSQLMQLERALGGLPSPEELQERTGFSPGLLRSLAELPVATAILDSPVGEEDGDTLRVELLADPSESASPDRELELESLYALLDHSLQGVPDRDRELYHLWIRGEDNMASLGKKVGISRERVRQILQRLTRILRRELQ